MVQRSIGIVPMLLCTVTPSYILWYRVVGPLHCVQDSSFGIVRLYYSLVITALSELEAQAYRYTRINIC